MKKAVQQIMLGTVTKNEKQTAETLRRIRAAGYDGIELNGFMVKPTSFLCGCSRRRQECRLEKAEAMTGMHS